MNDSDSSVQREVEEYVLHNKGLKPLEESLKIDGVEFLFDGYSENAVAEVYAGLDKLLAGQKRKIAQDILKMVLYEKLSGKKGLLKSIILVDHKIEQILNEGNSWLSKAIEVYNIKIEVVKLPPEMYRELVKAKNRQGRKFRKK